MRIFTRFLQSNHAPGILLAFGTLAAIAMVNSSFRDVYENFLSLPGILQFGDFRIDKPLLLWVNDGLMAIFFLLVGLEIKRELIDGHLATPSQAILPGLAALAGFTFPALIYVAINWGNAETLNGWAIPAATDIAFAIGIIMILDHRVPTALKVTLVAIAVIDDLAAIIVIALFYTSNLSLQSLVFASIGLSIAIFMNIRKVASLGPYVIVGLFIWASVLKSGVHATLAGVALGLIIPLKSKDKNGNAPLEVMEHALQPWVSLFIVPVFAFANAGISFDTLSWDSLTHPVTLGIMLGLFFGKQIGVMSITYLSVRLGFAKLPQNSTWGQYYGMALLTGIGFTMSLFIGTLAFSDLSLSTPVRLGVITGSALSAVFGLSVLLYTTKDRMKS